jgi:hypothetical protein
LAGGFEPCQESEYGFWNVVVSAGLESGLLKMLFPLANKLTTLFSGEY